MGNAIKTVLLLGLLSGILIAISGAAFGRGGRAEALAISRSREISGERDAGYALPTTPAAAHFFIVNPLTSSGVMSLFFTHSPAEERIARLRKMVV